MSGFYILSFIDDLLSREIWLPGLTQKHDKVHYTHSELYILYIYYKYTNS